jgi:hypothetical protein
MVAVNLSLILLRQRQAARIALRLWLNRFCRLPFDAGRLPRKIRLHRKMRRSREARRFAATLPHLWLSQRNE